jgi:restriction system protein
MARRDEDLFDLLIDAPWWASVCVAAVVFLGMRFGLPALPQDNILVKALGQQASQYAWIASIFLLPAGFSAIRSARKRRLLDRQSDIESIRALTWKQFEELLGEAYRREGYSVVENTGAGADGGVDLTLRRNGQTYLVQCKQWRTFKVGVKVVREMFGLMTAHLAAGTIIVTSGTFTKEAEDFAAGKPIELVEGDRLVQMISAVQKKPLPVAPMQAPVGRRCPKCGGELVVREAKRGARAGSKFWGCTGYPKCRHTEEYLG